MISDEELEEIAKEDEGSDVEFQTSAMARELLAHRKAWSEPVYQVDVYGGWADVSEDDFETAEYKGEATRKVYRKPSTE
ncbi:hypothetical protein [Pantoea sp.]|uniref:hypothetical protein n=1 Tax=Pantoea sp. TaxID=69393 RepID=UPI0029001FDA|nr:hypothetical protein [Pantoea sp.]MDU2729998.1 hypothetical protein [Pantoea sp.]